MVYIFWCGVVVVFNLHKHHQLKGQLVSRITGCISYILIRVWFSVDHLIVRLQIDQIIVRLQIGLNDKVRCCISCQFAVTFVIFFFLPKRFLRKHLCQRADGYHRSLKCIYESLQNACRLRHWRVQQIECTYFSVHEVVHEYMST